MKYRPFFIHLSTAVRCASNTIFYGSEFYRSSILGNHESADILIGMEALCRCDFSFKKEDERFVFELELREV
ncbi:MAG: hypothetical protein KBT03_03265 [Bacteroidales bacterium]|nr:hypothetical protein [Candidatus Scybalousia scybalohippi]